MVQAQNLGARSVPIALCSKRYQCVIDVGGGMGGLVASLLQNMPGLQQGVVYDLPEVMARAQKVRGHPSGNHSTACGYQEQDQTHSDNQYSHNVSAHLHSLLGRYCHQHSSMHCLTWKIIWRTQNYAWTSIHKTHTTPRKRKSRAIPCQWLVWLRLKHVSQLSTHTLTHSLTLALNPIASRIQH